MARSLALGLLLLLSTPALAAEPGTASDATDKERAAQLFKEARALAELGNLEEACQKLEQSVELHEGVGNRFNLADCWEKTGRTASAYTLFIEVADATRELGQSDREKTARARAEALAPKLTRMRIDVGMSETTVAVPSTCTHSPKNPSGNTHSDTRGSRRRCLAL